MGLDSLEMPVSRLSSLPKMSGIILGFSKGLSNLS